MAAGARFWAEVALLLDYYYYAVAWGKGSDCGEAKWAMGCGVEDKGNLEEGGKPDLFLLRASFVGL